MVFKSVEILFDSVSDSIDDFFVFDCWWKASSRWKRRGGKERRRRVMLVELVLRGAVRAFLAEKRK